jgi:integrase
MRTRQQLPPQIRKVDVLDRTSGRSVVRYQLRADGGVNDVTGHRQQVKRHYATEKQARAALGEIVDQSVHHTFVAKQTVTVDQLCADYLLGRYNLRATALSKLAYDLSPLRERYGAMPVQTLTKAHLDVVVRELIRGGSITAKGRARRPWSPVSVNKSIDSWSMVLHDAHRQGVVSRNVGELVQHVVVRHRDVSTYTEDEVRTILESISDDRLSHAWELALSGLRRGEIAGLRWCDVDLDARTLAVTNNRVDAGGVVCENDPKTLTSRRTLPLPERLVTVLKSAKARHARERLALGYGHWAYVVCNEIGEPYSPQVLSRGWRKACKRAGVREIKLHAARHTCATLMHLQGVPTVVIAAWIGHSDPALTMRLYAHSQADALKAAGDSLNRVVSPTCH